MEDLKRRQALRRKLYSKTSRAIILLVLLFLIKPTWNLYAKYRESSANLENAKRELATLEAKQKDLTVRVDNLQSDVGRDEEIRSKYGVAKEGETTVVFVEDKNHTATSTQKDDAGFWASLWSGFLSFLHLK